MGRGDWDDGIIMEDDELHARPFVVASGKTRPTAKVSIETLVQSNGANHGQRFERGKVLDRATEAISIAELSSHLSMPIGTTMVVVGELIDAELLAAHKTADQSDVSDLNIMTRIIQRVREL